MDDDDTADWHADLLRPDLVVLMPERVAFQVRVVENSEARSTDQVLDAGFLRIEARGPIGADDQYLWLAGSRDLAVISDPTNPQELTAKAKVAIEEWAAWRKL